MDASRRAIPYRVFIRNARENKHEFCSLLVPGDGEVSVTGILTLADWS